MVKTRKIKRGDYVTYAGKEWIVKAKTKDGKKALFMLTYNQSSPDCCPSTYSSSTGCVCTTQNQRDFVKTRGHNRSKFTYPGI